MAEETKQDSPPPKKSKKMLFILVGVAVLGAAGAGGFFMMGGGETAAAPAPNATPAAAAEVPAGLVHLDTFLVNLADPGGDRYMKMTMRLAVAPESAADKASGDEILMARIRDRVLSVVMSKTFAELANPLGKDGLRLEIQSQVDAMLTEGTVRDVLFAEFVIQ